MSETATMDAIFAVNEVFDTLQGEATHTGTPATFIRLQGCPVGCAWCDTKHTWTIDPGLAVPPEAMLAKEANRATYALLTAAELTALLAGRAPRSVVITGGEPCLYDLRELTYELRRSKRLVQIETSGTQPVRADDSAWVTLSPKVGMSGGFSVRRDAVLRADEIKWPVGREADIGRLEAFIAEHNLSAHVRIWLQPLSRSPKATTLCIEAASRGGWRVSVQVHALLGLR